MRIYHQPSGFGEVVMMTREQPNINEKVRFRWKSKGGVVAWTWKRNAWDMLIWYHGIKAIGLFFPYIPKSTNIPCVMSQWRHIDRFCPNCWFTVKYRPKLIFFRQKSSKCWNFTGFVVYKTKKMTFLTYTVRFKTILKRYFSK